MLHKESSEESDEEKTTIPRCNNRYNLRQDTKLPQRYGTEYTHLVDICHGQLILENWPYRERGVMIYDVKRNIYICIFVSKRRLSFVFEVRRISTLLKVLNQRQMYLV